MQGKNYNKIDYKTFKKAYILIIISCCIFSLFGCHENIYTRISTYKKADNEDLCISIMDGRISSETLYIKIVNNTNLDITYDSTYIIEKMHDNKWYVLNENQNFNALGIILRANSSNELQIKFEKRLSNGDYRLIKPFIISSKTNYYDVEFKIEGE